MLRTIRTVAWIMAVIAVVGAGEATTTSVTVAKRGNVRFAPSLNSGVILTLEKGATVKVYGPEEANPDWYVIAFPREGYAWVHEQHIAESDEEGVCEVVTDGTNVRSDSRINSRLVDQLALGERVILTGKRVGRWRSVWPGNARAYMHRSVLALGTAEREEIDTNRSRAAEVQAFWEETREIYRDYRVRFNRDSVSALALDWDGLSARLKRVMDEHPSVNTRLKAQRLRTAIVRVVSAAREAAEAEQEGAVVVEDDDGEGSAGTGQEGTGTGQEKGQEEGQEEGREVEPLRVDEQQLAELREAPGYTKGWVVPNKERTAGTRFKLLDSNHRVVAYLKVRPGSTIDLERDFYWKLVGVKGDTERVRVGDEEYTCILVKEIRLLNR